jgi:DNA-binding MarR family transcriptional regulator
MTGAAVPTDDEPVPPRPLGGPDTGDELTDALLMAGHRVRTAMDQCLRQDGLSLARLKVLRLLEGAPMPMGRMSSVLEVVPRSTTDIVDGMVSAGLIERHSHPTDRRVVLLQITPEGKTRLAVAQRHASEVAAWATRNLSGSARPALLELLARIGAPDVAEE